MSQEGSIASTYDALAGLKSICVGKGEDWDVPVAAPTPLFTPPVAVSKPLFAAPTPEFTLFCAVPVAFCVAPDALLAAPEAGAAFLFCGLTSGGTGLRRAGEEAAPLVEEGGLAPAVA